jgi:hypothetical protein
MFGKEIQFSVSQESESERLSDALQESPRAHQAGSGVSAKSSRLRNSRARKNHLAAQSSRIARCVPMSWAGANENGEPVFGVAASAMEVGSVDVAAFAMDGNSISAPSLHRTLTTLEARRLAQHLTAAADDADRLANLRLVAIA